MRTPGDASWHVATLQLALEFSLTEIGEIAFNGCDQLTLIVERDSYAADYCEEQGLDYNYADAND